MGYKITAIKGVGWLTAFRGVSRGFSIVKTVVVARFLSPSQFGLFGIATVVLAFIEVVTETGVNVFLVQQKGKINKYLGTALLISIIRGTLISITILISTPYVADFFQAPDAKSILYTMSIIPFLRGFVNPSVVKLQKDLLFRREFFFRSTVISIEITSTVILLFLYPEPITLIWGIIVGVITEVMLSYLLIKPRPMIDWNIAYISKMIHSGKWVTSAVIFNYGFERGDDIVVGRMLGTGSLGIYDMAYRFSLLPITELVNMVIRVVFPVYVRISGDYIRLRNAYLKTILTVATLVFPFGLIVFIFPEPIIRLVLGEKWIEAAPILQVLVVLGVIRAVTLSASSILLALKLQKRITFTMFVSFVGMFASIIPFINSFGLIGAAYAATLGYLLSVPFVFYYSFSALKSQKSKKII